MTASTYVHVECLTCIGHDSSSPQRPSGRSCHVQTCLPHARSEILPGSTLEQGDDVVCPSVALICPNNAPCKERNAYSWRHHPAPPSPPCADHDLVQALRPVSSPCHCHCSGLHEASPRVRRSIVSQWECHPRACLGFVTCRCPSTGTCLGNRILMQGSGGGAGKVLTVMENLHPGTDFKGAGSIEASCSLIFQYLKRSG